MNRHGCCPGWVAPDSADRVRVVSQENRRDRPFAFNLNDVFRVEHLGGFDRSVLS